MKNLTVKDVEFIAHRVAKEVLKYNEPIPDFSTRYPGRLESCLAVPFQTFFKKNLYSGITNKAAVLFYLLIKNHPFQNGNKRIAITSLMVFLYKNKKWLRADIQELYNFTIWVAQSPAELKEEVVNAAAVFIKRHMENLSK